MGNRKHTEKIIFIALFVALSVVLGIFDKYLSALVSTEGVRIGLANIVILTGIYYLNFRESFVLVVLKSVITGFLFGSYMTFLVGFSGTLLSFMMMYSLLQFGKGKVSLIGTSVAGGISHNIGQILMLAFSGFYSWTIVFNLIWLIPMGIGTGLFVGYVVFSLKRYLDQGNVFKTITRKNDTVQFNFEDDDK